MRQHGAWPVAMSAVAVLVLLGALDRVLRHAVQQGAQRRAEVLARAEATWRCNYLQGRQAQTACRAALR